MKSLSPYVVGFGRSNLEHNITFELSIVEESPELHVHALKF